MNKLNQQQQQHVAMAQASFLNQLTPAQLVLLQQQFQQSQANYDLSTMQQNLLVHQQRMMLQQHHQQQHQQQQQQLQKISTPTGSPFSSSFSVNSLLSQQQHQTQSQVGCLD